LRGSLLLGIDIIVITETKIDDERYTRFSHGYKIHATKALSKSQGGVALAIRKERGQNWDVEDLSVDSANVIGCTLVLGEICKQLIGVYLPPSKFDGKTLDVLAQVIEAAKDLTIVMGDFNATLGEKRDAQRQGPLSNEGRRAKKRQIEVLATIASMGLQDTAKVFRQRARTGTWTWVMTREGERVRSTVDYVLVKGDQPVRRHQVRRVAYVNTDHRIQQQYMKQLQTFPVPLPKGEAMTQADKLFQACLDERKLPDKQQTGQEQPHWISDATWSMIRQKAEI
jgi:exonuclease III